MIKLHSSACLIPTCWFNRTKTLLNTIVGRLIERHVYNTLLMPTSMKKDNVWTQPLLQLMLKIYFTFVSYIPLTSNLGRVGRLVMLETSFQYKLNVRVIFRLGVTIGLYQFSHVWGNRFVLKRCQFKCKKTQTNTYTMTISYSLPLQRVITHWMNYLGCF